MTSLRALRSFGVVSLWAAFGIGVFAFGAGCGGRKDSTLAVKRDALTGCLPKSVTTVPTTGWAYDRAGRQSLDRDAQLIYDVWSQLREVRPVATASPKYNDGRPVVPEKHTYGFDGMRTSTTTNPDTANAVVRIQITPDDVVHDGRREHYVRIGDRIIARLAMNSTGVAAIPSGGDHRLNPSQRHEWRVAGADHRFPVTFLAFAAVALAMLASRRRRARWGASLAGIVMLSSSCGILGVYDSESSSSLILAETFYFHNGLGAGPTLITQQDGSIVEERRYEPFGAPIDAYRSGRGVAAVDLVKDPQSIVGKQTDTSNGFSDHGARWMTPFSARWLTPDPAMRDFDSRFLAQPWGLNTYAYALQNPMGFWDPDGKDPVCSATQCPTVERVEAEQILWEHVYLTRNSSGAQASLSDFYTSTGTLGSREQLAKLVAMRDRLAQISWANHQYSSWALNRMTANLEGAVLGAGGLRYFTILSVVPGPKGSTSNARFEVTEGGVAIPTEQAELTANLSKLQDVSTSPATSRKFVGVDSQGPVRVRVEQAHPDDPTFTGTPDPLHTVDHLHIDRRENGTTGSWQSEEKVPYDWPF